MDLRTLFSSLGNLVANAGKPSFPVSMHELIARSVPADFLSIEAWTTDEAGEQIATVLGLGSAGPAAGQLAARVPALYGDYQAAHTTVRKILDAQDAQLILAIVLNTPDGAPFIADADPARALAQCNLVFPRAPHRYLISLYRPLRDRDFSLQELAFLKDLSDILLPVVEWHALTRRRIERPVPQIIAAGKTAQPAFEQVRQNFTDRLQRAGLVLSPREMSVCLLLLTGNTVPEIAAELKLRANTVETYIKRAAIKLDVRGRHGLARWMMAEPLPEFA
ncbi:helix-turn-helix transcriptional regulator [Paraburkholderia jirisanensis]